LELHELHEHVEHANHSGEKAIGLTTAIVAVLLALATLQSHRAQTEVILALTQNVDDWNFYQAKHDRAYMFGLAAEMQSLMPNGKAAALKNIQNSVEEECGTPAPEGCTSPVLKKSSVIQALIQESKPQPGAASEAQSSQVQPSAPATTAAQNQSSDQSNDQSRSKREKAVRETAAKEGAVAIQERAKDGQNEVRRLERKTNLTDTTEVFLEISIVLCSIALLAENKLYWKVSFISTGIGVIVALLAIFVR
jgi:hypothetical protein